MLGQWYFCGNIQKIAHRIERFERNCVYRFEGKYRTDYGEVFSSVPPSL